MSAESEAKCPCCGGQIDYFPDQDGSCGYQCTRCSWHQHVPGDAEVAEFEGRAAASTGVTSQMLGRLKVDLKLLKQQAAILGNVIDGTPLTKDERYCLEGLWEFVHRIIDRMESQDAPDSTSRARSQERT